VSRRCERVSPNRVGREPVKRGLLSVSLKQGLNFYRATILDCSAQDENLFRHRKSNQRNIVLQRAAILSPRVGSANENEFSRALGNFDDLFRYCGRADCVWRSVSDAIAGQEGLAPCCSGGCGTNLNRRQRSERRVYQSDPIGIFVFFVIFC
jgi:hypothetical protein